MLDDHNEVLIGTENRSTILPFLNKWIRVPENYQDICQQATREMHRADFVATWHIVTAWGNKPE
ncbi:MAG TPA: hypothetical protein VFN35_00220 [Ktedonobacteraceae bacterium]|nr:hypothetical protein [Ktedonobacteraceae bacterium]